MAAQRRTAYEIRTVRPQEWPRMKDLRLAALQDPIAPVAFEARYEEEAAFADEVWQRRVGRPVFVAVPLTGPDTDWAGTVTVLDETEGPDPRPQAHLVGMYVRPPHRGTGAADALVRAAVDRSWGRTGVERVRLWVAEGNDRASAFYRRIGFLPTGRSEPHPHDPSLLEHELVVHRPAGR